MEKLEYLACTLGADAWNLGEIGDRCGFDCFQRAEVMQQCAFARRTDSFDLLQAGLAHVLFAKLSMRTDDKAMCLVAQPLDEVEHGIARFKLQWRTVGDENCLLAGV